MISSVQDKQRSWEIKLSISHLFLSLPHKTMSPSNWMRYKLCFWHLPLVISEMDTLRQPARISKLDRKTNECIRGKMDAQDTMLDDITRKQLIWYGHVERMDPTRLPNMINWKPEGRKKTRSSPKNLERWDIYSSEWKRSQNGRMEQSKAMEYGSRKESADGLKPRNICTCICICVYICTYTYI
jgi:hypothetical protein